MNSISNAINKNYILDFGKQSNENIEYLRIRINIKRCPNCNSNATLILRNGNTIVENICCKEFADTIKVIFNVRDIYCQAGQIRGEVLNIICQVELFIDDIISMTISQYPSHFKDLSTINFDKNDLGMRERKKCFQKSLNIYSTLTNIKADKIWACFCYVIDKRNIIAHWDIDITEDAIMLFSKNNQIRFVKRRMWKIVDINIYSRKKATELIRKVEQFGLDIIEIYEFFSSKCMTLTDK